MQDPLPVSLPLRTATLGKRSPTRFDLKPDAAEREALAGVLGITALPRLRFRGELRPLGRADLELEARLEATVVQPCVITLAPVTTRIDIPVRRRYLRDFVEPEDAEAEIPEDDSIEPLPDIIDPGAVMTEALALALPDYPRAPGAVHTVVVIAPPDTAPLQDADMKPFAGLAGLVPKISGSDDERNGADGGGGDAGN